MEETRHRLRLPQNQMSEAFTNNAILALSGGLQDAYTYNKEFSQMRRQGMWY